MSSSTEITNENIKDLVKKYLQSKNRLPSDLLEKPIGEWDVSRITNMAMLFKDAKNFNESLNNWDVSKVKNMTFMFWGATKFNQPLNAWDVSDVEYMTGLFRGAIAFNQPLDAWNVKKVEEMSFMFNGAKNFNQSLDDWDVSPGTNTESMFTGATSYTGSPPWESDHIDSDSEGSSGLDNRPEMKNYYNITAEELLDNPDMKITDTTVFDVIMREDIKIGAHLGADKKNLCFVHKTSGAAPTYYLSNRNDILGVVRDENAIKYPCNSVDTTILPRIENVNTQLPLFPLNSIGISLGGYVKLAQIKSLILNEKLQKINIIPYDNIEYPAVASMQMMGNAPNAVSASHCQEGTSGKLYKLENITSKLISLPIGKVVAITLPTGGKKAKRLTKKGKRSSIRRGGRAQKRTVKRSVKNSKATR